MRDDCDPPINFNTTNNNVSVVVKKDDVDTTVVKSAVFLKKLEQKAMDNVIESLTLTGNGFEGKLYVALDNLDMCYKVKVVFNLNGKVIVVNHIAYYDGIKIDELIEEVSKEIAKNVLASVITQATREVQHINHGIFKY